MTLALSRAALCAVLLACLPLSNVHAWGATGHRLVGALAQDELDPVARAEVARLLAGEAEPTLAGVANWADALRDSDPVRGRATARWHYVNLGEHGCRAVPAACPDGQCVQAALLEQAAVLADRARPLAARRDALKFVVHFVGDVHQPLHAAWARDKGGNDAQVSLAQADGTRRGSNLHSLWDSGLLRESGDDEAAHLQRLRALPLAVARERPAWPPQVGTWAEDSCAIALRPGFYPPSPRLDARYGQDWRPVVDVRLRTAGARLAVLLNAAIGRGSR